MPDTRLMVDGELVDVVLDRERGVISIQPTDSDEGHVLTSTDGARVEDRHELRGDHAMSSCGERYARRST